MNWTRTIQKGIAIMIMASAAFSYAAPPDGEKPGEKLKTLLQRPLIIGASVSNDRGAQSPGKKLALHYTSLENIKLIARNGSGGFKILRGLEEAEISDRSVILALDLFFWDSTLKSSLDLSLEELGRLTRMAEKLNIPLVIGEVPDLLPGFQPARLHINDAIEDRCADERRCYMLSLDPLLRELRENGFLTFKGRRLTMKDLVPDGLHLSSVGSELLAEQLKELLERKLAAGSARQAGA